MEKEILMKLVNEGLSLTKISENTGSTISKVKYWLKKYGLKTKNLSPKKN